MKSASFKPMYIYISGPYSPDSPQNETTLTPQQQIEENIEKANVIALEIAKKGHFPFVPHTMMRGWEDQHGIERALALNICEKWVEKCDALFFISPSVGAEIERQLAQKLGLPIYGKVDDIPESNNNGFSLSLSPEAIEAYLTEYRECMESYRHTYTTLWQAGGIFAAISAALVSFAEKGGSGITPLIQVLSPIPVLFWWRGIFIPMNRYGERRNTRLVQIEETLSDPAIKGLQMRHFRDYSNFRKGEGRITRLVKFKWLWQPRVIEIVTIFGYALLALEIYLIANNYHHFIK